MHEGEKIIVIDFEYYIRQYLFGFEFDNEIQYIFSEINKNDLLKKY